MILYSISLCESALKSWDANASDNMQGRTMPTSHYRNTLQCQKSENGSNILINAGIWHWANTAQIFISNYTQKYYYKTKLDQHLCTRMFNSNTSPNPHHGSLLLCRKFYQKVFF